MANNFKTPWSLDTVSVTDPTKSGRTILNGVTFLGYASASDKCIIKDTRNVVIVELWGNADLSPVAWSAPANTPVFVDGFRLATLGSGTAVVYVN